MTALWTDQPSDVNFPTMQTSTSNVRLALTTHHSQYRISGHKVLQHNAICNEQTPILVQLSIQYHRMQDAILVRLKDVIGPKVDSFRLNSALLLTSSSIWSPYYLSGFFLYLTETSTVPIYVLQNRTGTVQLVQTPLSEVEILQSRLHCLVHPPPFTPNVR